MKAFGDSITKGSAVFKSFPSIIAQAKSWAISNFGIDGAQAADIADSVYGNSVAAGDIRIIAVGENDQRTNGGDTTKQTFFSLIHKALVAFSAIADSNKIFGNSASVNYSAGWVDGLWGFGKYTNAASATATFQFTGSTLYLGMILSDPWTGTFSVKVDGVVVATGSSAASGKISTVLGRVWAPMLVRISGLSIGQHTVIITNTSAGGSNNYIAFDWAAAPSADAKVYVGEITKMTSSGYSQYGGSDASVDLFNKLIGTTVGDLYSDGLDIHIVNSPIVPNSDLADGLHPTQAGHQKIATNYINVMNNF